MTTLEEVEELKMAFFEETVSFCCMMGRFVRAGQVSPDDWPEGLRKQLEVAHDAARDLFDGACSLPLDARRLNDD